MYLTSLIFNVLQIGSRTQSRELLNALRLYQIHNRYHSIARK